MLTYVRCALATIGFTLSVACLGLWWRSTTRIDIWVGPSYLLPDRSLVFETFDSTAATTWVHRRASSPTAPSWEHTLHSVGDGDFDRLRQKMSTRFGLLGRLAYFPLWYAALVFALAGFGPLRLGRRFTGRSAIIATTVVAGLLEMAAAL
jgi:hypothetical protein